MLWIVLNTDDYTPFGWMFLEILIFMRTVIMLLTLN